MSFMSDHSKIRRIASGDLTNTMAGLVGEHIAAAAILQAGWGVAMAQQDSVDLVAFNKITGQRLLVQVKSCQSSRRGDAKLSFVIGLGGIKQPDGTKKKRMPNPSDYDIIALVSSEHRSCYFMPVTALKYQKITRAISYFTDPHIEVESWEEAVRSFNEKSAK